MATVDVLSEAGFHVLEAASAMEAIALLETHSEFDIIFTDIGLKDSIDRIELLRIVADRWPLIHEFATSGHCQPDRAQLPDGATFFSKPYNPGQLIQAFNSARGHEGYVETSVDPECRANSR